jgi:hypothetical protein
MVAGPAVASDRTSRVSCWMKQLLDGSDPTLRPDPVPQPDETADRRMNGAGAIETRGDLNDFLRADEA